MREHASTPLHYAYFKNKNTLDQKIEGININLALPTFPARCQASIIGAVDFTSVFEMGTGVSPQPYAPGNFQTTLCV
jgi:hypothetical protein